MFDLCDNELIKFTFVAFKIAKTSLPEYSCKKSKYEYIQHQIMALLCLMNRLKLDYRVFIPNINLMPEIQALIGLKDVPHLHYIVKIL